MTTGLEANALKHELQISHSSVRAAAAALLVFAALASASCRAAAHVLLWQGCFMGEDTFVSYLIEVRQAREGNRCCTWAVRRRYSEFERFHKRVCPCAEAAAEWYRCGM